MSARRESMGGILRRFAVNQKKGDLLYLLNTLQEVFHHYALVAVHLPTDRIVFGEEYVDEQVRLQDEINRSPPPGLN